MFIYNWNFIKLKITIDGNSKIKPNSWKPFNPQKTKDLFCKISFNCDATLWCKSWPVAKYKFFLHKFMFFYISTIINEW